MSIKHMDLACQLKGEKVATREMKKHIGWYLKGMKESTGVRDRINRLNSRDEMVESLLEYEQYLKKVRLA